MILEGGIKKVFGDVEKLKKETEVKLEELELREGRDSLERETYPSEFFVR